MNKIYSLALAAIGFLFVQGAAAQTKESLEANYDVATTLDFSTNTYSTDPSITLGEKTGTKAYETGNKKQQELYHVTAPEELAGHLAFQGVGSKGWAMRSSKGGLWCYNANRSAAVLNLKKDQVVAFNCTQSPSKVITLTDGNGNPDGPFTYTLDSDNNAYYATMTADGQVGFCGARSVGYISSIVIYSPKAGVEFSSYTIKYVNEEGTEIADARTASAMAGAAADITATDKNPITKDGIKYIYTSDDSEGKTVASDGSTVVTVKFHAAKQVSYALHALNANGDTIKANITTGTDYEDETAHAAFPEYINVDGTLYETAKQDKGYYISIKLEGEKVEKTVTYNATETTGVVYLAEGEDISGLTPVTSANSGIRSSNGGAAYASEDTYLTSLPAGKYKLSAVIFDASKSPNSNWYFIAGTDTVAKFNATTVNYQAFTSDEFTVTKDSPLYFAKGGSNIMGLDLVYVVKTGDYTAPEEKAATVAELKALESGTDVTFTATDVYVTCASQSSMTSYIQDNTGAIALDYQLGSMLVDLGYADGKKLSGTLYCQYTVSNGLPTLTIADKTGESTGIAFTDGAATPAETSAADYAKDENLCKLIVVKNARMSGSAADGMTLTQGEATATVYDVFNTLAEDYTAPDSVLSVTGIVTKNWEGTIVIAPYGENAIVAYEATPTGISDVSSVKPASDAIYTLSGVKVGKATKGLYIIGGKKVVVK